MLILLHCCSFQQKTHPTDVLSPQSKSVTQRPASPLLGCWSLHSFLHTPVAQLQVCCTEKGSLEKMFSLLLITWPADKLWIVTWGMCDYQAVRVSVALCCLLTSDSLFSLLASSSSVTLTSFLWRARKVNTKLKVMLKVVLGEGKKERKGRSGDPWQLRSAYATVSTGSLTWVLSKFLREEQDLCSGFVLCFWSNPKSDIQVSIHLTYNNESFEFSPCKY